MFKDVRVSLFLLNVVFSLSDRADGLYHPPPERPRRARMGSQNPQNPPGYEEEAAAPDAVSSPGSWRVKT